MKKQLTFVAAMRDFFGYLPGQTLPEFMEEVRKLTEAERAEFKRGLEQNGYKIIVR